MRAVDPHYTMRRRPAADAGRAQLTGDLAPRLRFYVAVWLATAAFACACVMLGWLVGHYS
jgi:hypothetical protein